MVSIKQKVMMGMCSLFVFFTIIINSGIFPNLFLRFISYIGESEEVNFYVD